MTSKALSNVLVVDDKEEIILVIESALENQPVNFFSATNGRDAFRLLEENPIDLLLVDIKMPDITGFEICRRVKNKESWRGVKIIVVSASNSAEDKLKAFDVGADDYISKPFRIKELQARIKVMLNLRKAEKDLREKNYQLLELIRVSEVLNRLPDQPRSLYEEVVTSAARLSQADLALLLLWDEENKTYNLVGSNIEISDFPGRVLPPFPTNYKPLNSENFSFYSDDIIHPEILKNLNLDPTKPLAGIPLRLGQRKLGLIILALDSPEGKFAASDLEILGTLANQAAIAIENSRLYNYLSQSEGRYRLIAENASDLIITLDRNERLTYVNERVESLLGFRPEELLGKDLNPILTPEGQSTLKEINQTLLEQNDLENGSNKPHEIEAIKKDGSLINLEFNTALLFEHNEITGLQAIGRDVTLRKRETEQERMRALGQMASGVAHDFNNVLANVLGHAQLLQAETDDQEILKTLRIIEQSALDGAETVRRIQEFTGNQLKQSFDPVDVNQVVQSTIELSRPRWRDDAQSRGQNIEIEKELEAVLPPIRGKAAELREVLINLVNNAVDAMGKEGGKIGFQTFAEPNLVCLDVWDTGKGMPNDIRRRIFEPFYTTKGVRGTGLGLSIAYGIISRYGGTISCESAPGKGTTFHIRLPAALDSFQGEKNRNMKEDEPLKQRFEGNILAIDDEPNIRLILNRALSRVGFRVELASNGMEALKLLEEAGQGKRPPFQLVFSDLGMPEMSGWEVAEHLMKGWPHLPLVLVTGWGDQLDREKMALFNIAHTVAKPFNITELVKLASQLIPQGQKN